MAEPFKNLISRDVVAQLASLAKASYPDFDDKSYRSQCLAELDSLELKERANLLGEALWQRLPEKPSSAFAIIRAMLTSLPAPTDETEKGSGWLLFPISSLLACHGLEAFKKTLPLLKELTIRFTAEFAIRPYLIERQADTLEALSKWARHRNPHVRRLVSEGSRPRLPWTPQIPAFIKDPTPLFPLLEQLKDDPSEYVRRSVANSLNDISKDHPEQMLERVATWLPDASKERRKLIRHACRSLIKQGHPRCLELLGHGKPELEVLRFSATPAAIKLGDSIELAAEFRSLANKTQNLVIDYRFQLVKANGQTAPKVFKGHSSTLARNEKTSLRKTFHLKPITTRKYYTGNNSIELMVNGIHFATCHFHLTA